MQVQYLVAEVSHDHGATKPRSPSPPKNAFKIREEKGLLKPCILKYLQVISWLASLGQMGATTAYGISSIIKRSVKAE